MLNIVRQLGTDLQELYLMKLKQHLLKKTKILHLVIAFLLCFSELESLDTWCTQSASVHLFVAILFHMADIPEVHLCWTV